MRSRHFPVAWGTVRRVQLAPRHRHLQRNPQQSDNHHHRLRSPATIPRVHRSVCSSRFITWLRQVCCRRSLHAKQSRPVTRLHGVLGRQHGLRRCNLQREMPSCKAHKAAARRQKRQPEPVSRVLYCLVHALVARVVPASRSSRCLACDEDYCGDPFIRCAGANRRRSGIYRCHWRFLRCVTERRALHAVT